ncbi:MAG: thiamine pyrophosphate-binding protein, partial [Chloroflexota bacterium]
MTGKRALLEQLRVDGVRHIFGNPGTTEQGFMDVLQDYPDVQYLLALHEGVAVSMADAYARVTRRPAFVEVHIAPGLGNALGMMHNARIGMSPLLIYAGQSASAALLQEPHLSGPLVDMARPVCKWAVQVEHAHDVPQAVRRALKVAEEPPQGPVFLSLPIDVLDEPTDAAIIPTSFTRWRSRPDPAAVQEAGDLLLRARQPVLLLGDGVFASGAQAEAVAVAELLGAPILECYASEFNAPATHPLYRGSVDFVTPVKLREALAGCDALLAVGAPLFQIIFPEPGRSVLDSATQVVQIDANSWQIGRNSPPAVGLLSDPKGALEDLAQQLRQHQTAAQRAQAEVRGKAIARENAAASERYWAAARVRWDETPITGPRLMSEIWDAAPANALFFTEAVTNGQHLERA